MRTVAAMHEQMHDRTRKQKEIRQDAQDVGAVLGKEQNARDREEPDANQKGSGTEEASRVPHVVLIVPHVIVCHCLLPLNRLSLGSRQPLGR
jgi:hypothetical protein